MGISLRTNMSSMRAARQIGRSNDKFTESTRSLASGQRINNASQDAGGQSVASTINSDHTSLRQAMRNTNEGLSVIHTAESSLDTISDVLTKLRELAIQASTDTYNTSDRDQMNTEYTNLIGAIQNVVSTSNYNRQSLLNKTENLTLQIGIQANADNQVNIDLSQINTTMGALGITALYQSISAANFDTNTIDVLDDALTRINASRSYLGSIQNRIENALNSATENSENMASAQSKIMDTDYAAESANSTRHQIMHQSGVAAMGQAKNMPQSIISLLS